MDIVFIEGLSVETTIGVFDWERKVKQQLIFDLEMAWDISAAAQADDLALTLDYKAVSERIVEHVKQTRFELLESLAQELADLLRSEFSITWLRLRLSKPGAVPQANNVGLLIERGQRGVV